MIGNRLHIYLALFSAATGAGCSDSIGAVATSQPGDPATASDGGTDAGDDTTDEADGGPSECESGYVESNGECVDVDECAQEDTCDPNAACANTAGSFSCACASGYSGDGATCIDIDECATDNGGCGEVGRATCVNNVGAPPTCGDIDECTDDNGGCGDPANYTCVNNDRVAPTCNDLGACNTGNGGCGDPAFNSCSYDVTGNVVCADINECLTANGGCGDPATMACNNPLGARNTCTDVDECASAELNECPVDQPCVNLKGSYYCDCVYPNMFDATSNTCRKTRVLVLDDRGATTLLADLQMEGFDAVDGGLYYEWNQSPNLSNFDTILWLEGTNFGNPLLPGVDQLFVDFVKAGGGLVRTGWGVWYTGYQKELGRTVNPLTVPLMPVGLLPNAPYDLDGADTWTITAPSSPLVRGISAPTFAATGGYALYEPLPGSEIVATTTDSRALEPVPVLSYTTIHGGTTVHVNDSLLYPVTTRVIEPEIKQIYFNAVHFSAQRTPN